MIIQCGDWGHAKHSNKSIVDELVKQGLLEFYTVGKKYYGWKLIGIKE